MRAISFVTELIDDRSDGDVKTLKRMLVHAIAADDIMARARRLQQAQRRLGVPDLSCATTAAIMPTMAGGQFRQASAANRPSTSARNISDNPRCPETQMSNTTWSPSMPSERHRHTLPARASPCWSGYPLPSRSCSSLRHGPRVLALGADQAGELGHHHAAVPARSTGFPLLPPELAAYLATAVELTAPILLVLRPGDAPRRRRHARHDPGDPAASSIRRTIPTTCCGPARWSTSSCAAPASLSLDHLIRKRFSAVD